MTALCPACSGDPRDGAGYHARECPERVPAADISQGEAQRLRDAWNEGGALTVTAAVAALHVADDALDWRHPLAKWMVRAALTRAVPPTAPADLHRPDEEVRMPP
ncbi:MAG: hypothetical protein AB7G21_09960 [Dehalococcoidia bacterium]